MADVRSERRQHRIHLRNHHLTSKVSTLKSKWIFTTGGDVSARAAVVNNVVYFPDWGGYIWAVYATPERRLAP